MSLSSCQRSVLTILFIVASPAFMASAFLLPTTASSAKEKPSIALSATVEATSSSKTKLVPPMSFEDMENAEKIKESYELDVQKTYGRYPLAIKNGKGCKLWTVDGKEYYDCVSGIATCCLGHSCDELTSAIQEQMAKVHHVSNLYLIPEQAALANWLTTNSCAEKAFFCNSGAEANEAALKLARRHAHDRGIDCPVIITALDSFHGRTLCALSATAQPKYHKGFGYGADNEMVQGFKYVPYNDIDALKAAVQEIQNTPGQGLAAIMMEALQGEGGIIPGNPDFFSAVRELCDETGALMICDEVQIGMGRSGKLWGYENLPVEPDVFTSAKALGGGVPIGAMLAGPKAANVFGPGDHASTYGGNPLACAAGLAVARYFSDNDVLTNVQARGDQLLAGLEKISSKYPAVLGDVRGWGLLQGVECVSADVTNGMIVQAAMEEGLLLVGAGSNVVRFVPPLIISEEELDQSLQIFDKAVGKVVAGK